MSLPGDAQVPSRAGSCLPRGTRHPQDRGSGGLRDFPLRLKCSASLAGDGAGGAARILPGLPGSAPRGCPVPPAPAVPGTALRREAAPVPLGAVRAGKGRGRRVGPGWAGLGTAPLGSARRVSARQGRAQQGSADSAVPGAAGRCAPSTPAPRSRPGLSPARLG